MREYPKVSIVVTSYNSEKYLAQTLQSLVEQTYPNLEILVSDDGSQDSTKDILRAFADRHQMIRLNFNTKNLGISRNYNLAVGMATGEFVIGISHDDLLPPEHVTKMIAHFDSPRVGLVHCNAMRIDSEGNQIKFVANDSEKIKKTKNPMKWLCFNNFIQSCGMMFRRQAFLDFGGWDEAFSYDSEWYTYIRYAENYSFVYTTDTFAYYRVHESNISKFLKGAKSPEFEAYRQRCRELALSKANLGFFDRMRVQLKALRKKIKRKLRA